MFGKLLQPKRFFYIKNALKAIGYRAPPWPTGGSLQRAPEPLAGFNGVSRQEVKGDIIIIVDIFKVA